MFRAPAAFPGYVRSGRLPSPNCAPMFRIAPGSSRGSAATRRSRSVRACAAFCGEMADPERARTPVGTIGWHDCGPDPKQRLPILAPFVWASRPAVSTSSAEQMRGGTGALVSEARGWWSGGSAIDGTPGDPFRRQPRDRRGACRECSRPAGRRRGRPAGQWTRATSLHTGNQVARDTGDAPVGNMDDPLVGNVGDTSPIGSAGPLDGQPQSGVPRSRPPRANACGPAAIDKSLRADVPPVTGRQARRGLHSDGAPSVDVDV